MTDNATPQQRRQLAGAYAAGVQALFTPFATRGIETASTADQQARQLLPASQALTAAAASGLAAEPGSLEQAAAEVQLLGGMALDLLVANRLVTSMDEGVRTVSTHPPVDLSELQALVEAPEAYLTGATVSRGTRGPAVSASTAFLKAAETALDDIADGVFAVGGDLVEGMLMLDAALLREAIAAVGADLAKELGDDLVGLGRQAINFVLEACNKLLAILGRDALAQAQAQLDTWLSSLQAGTLFPDIIGRLYNVQTIGSEIRGWHDDCQGADASLVTGADAVNALAGRFSAKTEIVGKVARALAFIKLAPPLMTPVGRLAIAAAYLGLLAYLVGSGYDHVDSDRLKLLDRVEGVRGLSQRLLVTSAA